jgi:hypothetical protein
MTVRRLLVPLLVGCAVVGFAAPASATPPERFSFTESGTEVLAHCDGFDILLDSTGRFRGTEFFNKSGEPVKAIIRGRITETMTNSVTGKTLVNRGVFTDFFRRIRGTDEFTHTVSGFDFQGKVAGRGPVVFQDVGRKVVDIATGEVISRTGHSNVSEEAFCAALA